MALECQNTGTDAKHYVVDGKIYSIANVETNAPTKLQEMTRDGRIRDGIIVRGRPQVLRLR